MPRISLYRSLIASAVIAGAAAVSGCESTAAKHHETAKENATNNWNLARVAILYQLAETQYKVGEYDKCTETLREAFATKAQFAPMHTLAAKVEIERGNLESASGELNAAIRIKSDDPEPYYLLGVVNQRWQKPEVACDYYQQAWNRKSDEVRYLLAVVEMEMSLGKVDEARELLESRVVYFEQSAAVRVALARIACLKNDFATGAKYYREAVTLMPDENSLRRSWTETLFYAGQYGEAATQLETIRKLPDLPDRVTVNDMLGQCYLAQHRYPEARNCFQEAIRDQSNDTMAYINLGKACLQTGELGISFAAAKKILKTDPENMQALIILALTQQKEKKWTDAGATLEKAARISPEDSTVLCMLGINAQQLGNPERAVGYFEKAAKADPQNPWAAELLGRPAPAAGNAQDNKSGSETTDAPAAANSPASAAATPVATKAP